MEIMKSPLIQVVQKLPSFTISKDDIPYLTRYYAFLADREFGNIFIHHFHRSDMDLGSDGKGLLHNHPFDWSFSIVLSGGYIEERRQPDDAVVKKIVRPGSLNFLSKKDYHRVDLLDEEKGAWTIFFTGSRKNNDWEFWDRATKQSIPWKNITGAIE
jgi:hypothetical protein